MAARSASDPSAGDPMRGLLLTPEAVDHLLTARPEPAPDWPSQAADDEPADGQQDELHRLAARAGLTELDLRLLLIALAPDLDRRFEQYYGYLNDDVSRRRATVGLALDLCGLPWHSAAGRARLHAGAPLRRAGLLLVEEEDQRPLLGRALTVPDRVVARLLGDTTPDARLAGAVHPVAPVEGGPDGAPLDGLALLLAKRLAEGGPVFAHLREPRPGAALPLAARALRAAGLPGLRFDPRPADAAALVPVLLREALLAGAALVVGPLPAEPGPLVKALAAAQVPVLLTGPQPWDAEWTDRRPLTLDAPRAAGGDPAAWERELTAAAGAPIGFDLADAIAPYHLTDDQIGRAARIAAELAAFEGVPLTAGHLQRGALAQSASGLEQHARRIRPGVDWSDLVLPEPPLVQLRELALRARHRDRVLGDWGLRAGGGRGRGVVALFAGDSGTGKTLAAEVVAADLGLDLYVVQLSSVVDKYVGETEKNLERIFTEADRVDAVLLFDEADAVFGKRSEVKDSHDRYANLESAYLLQRLESFDGIALLTTNLRSNIDEAFTRRLDLVVDFPFPDAGQRRALWRHSLARVPRADGLDPDGCAEEFELAGGAIRSAVVTAAYLAAGRGDEVTAADLLEGARREYRKSGRLVLDGGSDW
ncbi:ATP-binding protein [Kitasatospora viridis]